MAARDDAAVLLPPWPAAWSPARHLYVLGLDPGRETGWAVLRLDWELLLSEGFTALSLLPRESEVFAGECGTFVGSEPQIVDQILALCRGVWTDGVWDAGVMSDVMVLSAESFTLRMLSADEDLLSPVRILAMLRYAGRALPFPRVQHSPTDAKSVATDERLRYWGLHFPGPDHRRDALRQAVVTARKMVEPPFRRNILSQCGWLFENSRRKG